MNEAINILLEPSEVKQALKKALSQDFINNLRNRHKNVELDSKLRGYVGELAFKKWMNENGIELTNSNVKDYSSGMDIDFLYSTQEKELQLELKTSLIPDVDQALEQCIKRRDIKLIRRREKSIEELNGDIHVQLIFNQLRLRKDDWLEKQELNFEGPLEELYQKIAAFRYEKDTYLVGWIDKSTLIRQVNSKPSHLKKWTFGKREFWCCNLEQEAKKPMKLIEYMSNLS